MQKPKLFVLLTIVIGILGSVRDVTAQTRPTAALTVNMDRYGVLRVDQQEVQFSSFIGRVKEIATAQPDASVTIVAEESAPFRDVVHMVDAVRAAGVDRVGLLTEKSPGSEGKNPVPRGALVLAMDRNSVVRLNGKQIKTQNVRREFAKEFKNRADRSIFVEAHAGLSFDVVAALIDAAKEAGAALVGLLSTEQ